MKSKREKIISGKRSVEKLSHFRCGACNKWWSVGDAPLAKHSWHCPWCGTSQVMEKEKSSR